MIPIFAITLLKSVIFNKCLVICFEELADF